MLEKMDKHKTMFCYCEILQNLENAFGRIIQYLNIQYLETDDNSNVDSREIAGLIFDNLVEIHELFIRIHYFNTFIKTDETVNENKNLIDFHKFAEKYQFSNLKESVVSTEVLEKMYKRAEKIRNSAMAAKLFKEIENKEKELDAAELKESNADKAKEKVGCYTTVRMDLPISPD